MTRDTIDPARVTVGIPTYNRSRLLREAIESVLAQTLTDFRLIVSDNASTDDTRDVVGSFGDERIEYVRSERNIGAIGNFNRLIGLADTEALMILPDDDILYPGHLQAAVQVLDRHANVGLVYTAFDEIDEQSRVVQTVHPIASRTPVMIERRDRALERLMVSGAGIIFSSVVYRTKAIVAAAGLREEEEPLSDFPMWMRIARDWDFGYVAEPLIGFRPHSDTITNGIAARQGATSPGRKFLLYSQINFERRIDFLRDAPLDSRHKRWLRALASLQLVVDKAAWGLSSREVAAQLVDVVRSEPRIALRPALWRLVGAQLGGRRLRRTLTRSSRDAKVGEQSPR